MKSCSVCKNPESKVGKVHKRNGFLICKSCYKKLTGAVKKVIVPVN